jgi:sterol 3beta-glucosyltransferase
VRVLIVTSGTMGDVAPFGDLAVRLREAGHEVTIGTHERFAPVVRGFGAGFRPVAQDPSGLLRLSDDSENGETPRFELTWAAARRNVQLVASYTRDFAFDIAAAVEGSRADVVLVNTAAAPLAWHAAEAVGVPCMGTYVEFAHPSRDFFVPNLSWSLGPWLNRAGARAAERLVDAWIGRATAELRRQYGLPPLTPSAMRRRMEAERWPVCHGFSPAVFRRPADWRPGLHVVGYWWPRHLAGWRPPADLVDFLDAGPPPVLVDFGSLGASHAERLGEVVPAAVRRAGVRAVVRSASAPSPDSPPEGDGDMITIGLADYAWLMPRVSAVVHHAGSGTAAATLRAGVPSVTVPMRWDQHHWARRLDAIGVGPRHLSLKDLSADGLAHAVRRAVSSSVYRRRAKLLAEQVTAEDGAGRVVDEVGRLGS